MLHPDDKELWAKVEAAAWNAAARFNLPLNAVEPKRRPNGAWGLCYTKEGRIAILVRRKEYADEGGAWNRNAFGWPDIRNTVAHELAHLRFKGHGQEHKTLTATISDWLAAFD